MTSSRTRKAEKYADFPNQLVELHLDSTGGPPLVLRTRVEDAHDNILLVGAPPLQRGGNLVPIRVGTKLGIEFKSTDAAKEGGRFAVRRW